MSRISDRLRPASCPPPPPVEEERVNRGFDLPAEEAAVFDSSSWRSSQAHAGTSLRRDERSFLLWLSLCGDIFTGAPDFSSGFSFKDIKASVEVCSGLASLDTGLSVHSQLKPV